MPDIDLTAAPHTQAEIQHILDSTQGHILEKHRRDHVWNVLLDFAPAASGRQVARLLATVPYTLPSVSDFRNERETIKKKLDNGERPDARQPVCFVGVSAKGCERIGAGPDSLFSIPFRQGLRGRVIDKLGMSDSVWDTYWQDRRFDAILVCCAECANDLAGLVEKLGKHFGHNAEMIIEKGAVKRRQSVDGRKGYAIEHFGFADGISQPSLETDHDPEKPKYHSGFDPRALLNTVLIRDPLLPDGCAFGSYMAYVKIEQHVDAFNSAAADWGKKLSLPTDGEFTQAAQGAALLMGRHRDGAPLIGGGHDDNDFSRRLDPNGISWPFYSHICKMNPRDGVNRTSIVRRGITYDDGIGKGLLFQSFQADLEFQFELLASTWASDQNHPVAGCGKDILFMMDPAQQRDATRWAPVDVSRLVTVRGGEYFYFPSIPGIKALASVVQHD